MEKTRDKIAHTARTLFNQHGFFSVSLRMIALECHISVGNLNYHFKQREDLLKDLYFTMVKIFDARLDSGIPPLLTRPIFDTIVASSMKRMYEYRFFWTDLYRLLQLDEQIANHFRSVHQRRLYGYQQLLQQLEEQMLTEPLTADRKVWIAERMLDYSNSWLFLLQLEENIPTDAEHIDEIIWSKAKALSNFINWKEES